MSVPQIRIAAIEAIARKILMEYDPALLEGEPCAIPIETIIETKFDLILEYHILRKNGSILGETIFDDGAVILYDQYQHEYRLIGVKAGTILIDERLCEPQRLGRLRFTCGHELAHWVLHKKLYTGTGDVAAYDGNSSTDESNGIIERQADAMATALLMPLPQVKKCFYRLRSAGEKMLLPFTLWPFNGTADLRDVPDFCCFQTSYANPPTIPQSYLMADVIELSRGAGAPLTQFPYSFFTLNVRNSANKEGGNNEKRKCNHPQMS